MHKLASQIRSQAIATVTRPDPLVDQFNRQITYLRLSVTDRCDLRCNYCMPQRMTFLPKNEILTVSELEQVAVGFIDRGIRKIRITGGEPLVRKGVIDLFLAIGKRLGRGLDELSLTTNGTHLAQYAEDLMKAGVRRINVSLDTLDRSVFESLSRRDALDQVLEGIAVAQAVGLSIKINTVALKGVNDLDLHEIIAWAHARGFQSTLIEMMPLGEVDYARAEHYLPLSSVFESLGC